MIISYDSTWSYYMIAYDHITWWHMTTWSSLIMSFILFQVIANNHLHGIISMSSPSSLSLSSRSSWSPSSSSWSLSSWSLSSWSRRYWLQRGARTGWIFSDAAKPGSHAGRFFFLDHLDLLMIKFLQAIHCRHLNTILAIIITNTAIFITLPLNLIEFRRFKKALQIRPPWCPKLQSRRWTR